MKIHLTYFFVLFSALSFAQKEEIENHVKKAFECLKNNDIECHKSLWPEETIFKQLIALDHETDYPKEAEALYYESYYYRAKGKILEQFIEERYQQDSELWKNLTIQEIVVEDQPKDSYDRQKPYEHGGYLWLKDKKNMTDWVYEFGEIIIYKNKIYGGMFSSLHELDGISFKQWIKNQRNEGYETAEAAVESAVATEAENYEYAVADSAINAVELPILEEINYEGIVNGKKMIFHWEVVGFEDDKYYETCLYKYGNQDFTPFQDVVALNNGYFLFVELNAKKYFRLKQTDGKLVGFWFSTENGKEFPITFSQTD